MNPDKANAGASPGLDRVQTGLDELDELMMGGLPRGRSTVVGGAPGAGKTVFATQFLVSGARRFGENGVFVTFEEPSDDIETNMRSFGWRLDELRHENKLAFVDASPTASDELIIGEFDLSALLSRIQLAATRVGARRVVLDSLTQLFDHFLDDQKTLRHELFRMCDRLKKSGLTILLTAERDSDYGEPTRHRLEEFVADNVIILRNALHQERRRRTIEILKMRGGKHAEGEIPFTFVDRTGIVAVPLTSLKLEQKSSTRRVTSGNGAIDEMCGGGFFRDSVTLVSGATGTGKTLFVTNFLAGGVAAGERALLFDYEESHGQLLRNASGWGVDFARMVESGRLMIVCTYPETQSLPDHLLTIKRAVESFAPTRIAVDSLSALERVAPETGFREFLISLTSFIKKREIAGLCTATSRSLIGGESASAQNISTLTDSIVLLRYIQERGMMSRGLMVLKMRGSEHAKDMRRFSIDSSGMRLGSPFGEAPDALASDAALR